MNECTRYLLVLKMVLSYPSSLGEQAIIMPIHLQETRIRKYRMWKRQRMSADAIQKKLKDALLSNVKKIRHEHHELFRA